LRIPISSRVGSGGFAASLVAAGVAGGAVAGIAVAALGAAGALPVSPVAAATGPCSSVAAKHESHFSQRIKNAPQILERLAPG